MNPPKTLPFIVMLALSWRAVVIGSNGYEERPFCRQCASRRDVPTGYAFVIGTRLHRGNSQAEREVCRGSGKRDRLCPASEGFRVRMFRNLPVGPLPC
jgi:hypothetical protein